ncbi:uncharacterized protein N7506_001882 [Penicillium brevicompactum]|uniref:uncharacterized protein n=1 Tax=Penicillium brevicompactum TaxID=5074 RepID=UPI00254212F4|nr:uncharacterized protein N7506_001882 [Penicillium brevicompactum]KAJ5348629.1 hypothetical protein N7506_001882 [Penicillium brevicompactum]
MNTKDRLRLLRRLPKELIDHIISSAPLIFKPNVLTSLKLPRRKTQESYSRLWATIFKSEDWLLHIIQQYNVKPVVIGFGIPSVGQEKNDSSKEICLVLKILGPPTWFKDEEMQLFLDCLRKYEDYPTMFGLQLHHGIKLHMSAVAGNSEAESDMVPAAWQWKSKLFNQLDGPISTYYSIYGSGKVQLLRSNDIVISETSFELKLSHDNVKLPAKICFSRSR